MAQLPQTLTHEELTLALVLTTDRRRTHPRCPTKTRAAKTESATIIDCQSIDVKSTKAQESPTLVG